MIFNLVFIVVLPLQWWNEGFAGSSFSWAWFLVSYLLIYSFFIELVKLFKWGIHCKHFYKFEAWVSILWGSLLLWIINEKLISNYFHWYPQCHVLTDDGDSWALVLQFWTGGTEGEFTLLSKHLLIYFCFVSCGLLCCTEVVSIFQGKEEMLTSIPFARPQDSGPSVAIVTKVNRIQDQLVKKHDNELHMHLNRLEIAPQIYGM